MFWIRTAREQDRLLELVQQGETWAGAPDRLLFGEAPAVSDWTPAQHLAHATAVNRAVLLQIRRYLLGDQDLSATPDHVAETGRPDLGGYLVLLLGRLPRGRARSPRRFRPPERVNRGDLQDDLAAVRSALEALDPAALDASSRCARHPRLGMMRAPEWIRFAGIHTRHHHRIIRDVLDRQDADPHAQDADSREGAPSA